MHILLVRNRRMSFLYVLRKGYQLLLTIQHLIMKYILYLIENILGLQVVGSLMNMHG